MLRSAFATVTLIALPAHLAAQVEPQAQDTSARDSTVQVLPTIEVEGGSNAPYRQRSIRSATRTDIRTNKVPRSLPWQ